MSNHESKQCSFSRLLEIMERLRSSEGCQWDREQTHRSLTPFVIEEAHEVVDAIASGNGRLLADELGDLLLQVVFHAQIAAENNQFTMDDVITAICEKLVRRHPHVFADVTVESVADIARNWEAIKKEEPLSNTDKSTFSNIPKALPALLFAQKVQTKAAKFGFDWSDPTDVAAKLQEELQELTAAAFATEPVEEQAKQIEDELGDLLFSAVNLARHLKVDPELALRLATNKFVRRFSHMENLSRSQGMELSQLDFEQLDALWEHAKNHLRKKP